MSSRSSIFPSIGRGHAGPRRRKTTSSAASSSSICNVSWFKLAGALLAPGIAFLVAAVGGCASHARPGGTTGASRPAGPRLVARNVEATDYAGSQACAACHQDVAQAFASSPMHRMTRLAAGTTPAAPFQGESLFLGDDRATLETHDGARFVRLERAGATQAPLLYRVTRVLGGHHREDFVGVPVASYDAAPSAGDDELVLPVSYLLEKKRLRYKGYSVMVRERPRLSAGPVWNRTCLFCHNTVPLLSTLFGAFAGPHAPHYQGEVVDALLPRDRAEAIRTTDESGLLAAVAREVARLGGEPGASADAPALGRGLRGVLRGAIDTTRSRFTGAKLLEVGIGCESCHGGSREHVGDPSVHPSLLPRAPYLALAAEASPAEVEDRACARCHQVLFSRYPWTWEGGRRSAMPGGSHISSGEARDLLLGGCRGALRCSACHDPHAPASTADSARLATLETPRGNEVCLACHSALRLPAALRAHAHHDPTGAGGACIACHMPKKNMSLDGRLSRYHRIGSPTDPDRVLGDRPVECALCHADRTVEDLVHTMEAWWNKQYSREVLRASYGDLGERALVATLRRGKSHEKAVALAVLGGRRDREAAPLFAAELGDEYPLVREYAADALRSTFGEACDLDLGRDRATVEAAFSRCSQAAGFAIRPPTRAGEGDEPVEE